MNTTLLFAELLITGLHTGIWILLLAANVFGPNQLQSFFSAGGTEWKTAILIVLLAMFYILGIVFDRVADFIFFGWDNKIRKKILPNAQLRVNVMRFQLAKDNEHLNHQFEYTRSRLRIVRASALNFAITTIVLLSLILLHLPNTPETSIYIFFTVILGVLLTGGSIFAWYKLTQTYFMLVERNWSFHISQQKPISKTVRQGNKP